MSAIVFFLSLKYDSVRNIRKVCYTVYRSFQFIHYVRYANFFNVFLKFKVYIFVKYTIVFNISLVLRLSILLIEVSEPACLNTYIYTVLSVCSVYCIDMRGPTLAHC